MGKMRLVRIILILFGLVIIVSIFMTLGIKPESRKWYEVLFASDYLPLLNGFPSTTDADERIFIYKKLGEAYPYTKSSRYEYEKNYYCASGNRHSVVTVYEVIDPMEQRKIVQAARAIKTRYNTRSFSIEFYANKTGASQRDQFIWKVRID